MDDLLKKLKNKQRMTVKDIRALFRQSNKWQEDLSYQYIAEFQNCVLELFKNEIQKGILTIYFVMDKKSLKIALKNIEKELK